MADFVADFCPTMEQLIEKEVNTVQNEQCESHVDGSSNFKGIGLGIVLKSPQEDTIIHAITCDFRATNNEVEYEALIAGLTLAQ